MAKSDKTEKPTPKRRSKAKKEGMVARSPEISLWALILTGSFLIPFLFHILEPRVINLFYLTNTLTLKNLVPSTALAALSAGFGVVAIAVGIAGGVGFVLAFVAGAIQVGFTLTPKAIQPKGSRFSPAQNIKKVFSTDSSTELLKSVVKMTVVGGIGYLVIRTRMASLASGQLSLPLAISDTVSGSLDVMRAISGVGFIIAAVDYARKRQHLTKSLMMTKQEVKDESRESEGDPLVKGRIRRAQLTLSRSRMMSSVSKADVVVVNPTHYAVAIRYDPEKANAPIVVAKGKGYVAEMIKKVALENSIPIVRDALLARTLHVACREGQQIPPAFFMAVARLLAFVFRLSATARYYETSHVTQAGDLPEEFVQKAATLS